MRKILPAALLMLFCFPAFGALAVQSIKIGVNIPLTGDFPKIGEVTRASAQLLKKQINSAGGFEINGKRHKLKFIYADNEGKPDSAVAAAQKLILKDKVLFMVGPQTSSSAIAAGEVAESLNTPMISPNSTNYKTTQGRQYVMRCCFLDSFQGPVAAKFSVEEFGAKTAAVLFDIGNDYSYGLAKDFKTAFEKLNGPGSVTAYESFTSKDVDFSAQLTKIKAAKPDFVFTPQSYTEVPLIIRQARELGISQPFLGGDGWDSADLMNLCGEDCKGQYFVTHYAAAGSSGATKRFVEAYQARYGHPPDCVAALTYDAINLMLAALRESGWPSGNLAKDREALANKMRQIEKFEGVSGEMAYSGSGDPVKCATIVKIGQNGEFIAHKTVCPQ